MQPAEERAGFVPIEIPRPRRNYSAYIKIAAAVLVVGGLTWVWLAGYRPANLLAGTRPSLRYVEIGTGTVDFYVVETGSIESANDTTVRCEVEALMGLVGGSQATSKSGGAASGSTGGAGGAAGGSGSGADASTTKAKTTKKAGSSSAASKTGSSSTGSASGSSSTGGSSGSGSTSSSSTASGSGSGSASGSSSSSGASTSSAASTAIANKPVLRSFTYAVVPYVPMKSSTTKAATDTTKKTADSAASKGGGGGGRGGRGRGGMNQEEEKPGSTRIVFIRPEGSKVQAGDIVAELDKSSYEDEERSQRIRYLQAKSYVEQAESQLEVAQITLKEYRDGIYPQDLQLIRHYIESCEIEQGRSARNLVWSREMFAMSYRSKFQVKGDEAALEQAEIALKEARGMYERLSKFTGPKIIKSLEANVAAIQADLLNQQASFSLETQRLERLRRNIAKC
ncbi:MAG: HlyD family secretion protein, partial [Isosphaeraceae bacterium]